MPNDAPPSLLTAIGGAKLTAADGGAGDFFGRSVAVDGDTAVVGAPFDDTAAGTAAGSAYVFVQSTTGWTLQAKLRASDGAPFNFFGFSVALDGDTAVVGAPGDETAAGRVAGSAYVFLRSGTTWTEQGHLTASDGAAGDSFGDSVGVDGDTALIGAPFEQTPPEVWVGAAYAFVRSGTTWTQQAKLVATDGTDEDFFGRSVAVDGDTAVIGARSQSSPTEFEAGAAYAFVRSGTSWTQQAKLVASDQDSFDYFGSSVAVSGDTAIIGAPYDGTPAGHDAGSVYAFVRSGTTWTEQAHLLASDGSPEDRFGFSVAVVADTAFVGAYLDDTAAGNDAGSVYAFVRSGTSWTERAHLLAPDGAPEDGLGSSVAMDEDAAVFGAAGDDISAREDAGSAYVIWR
jgi:hypothetical protein